MKHGVDHLLYRNELAFIIGIAEPQTYLPSCIYVQTKEIPLARVEFAEGSYFPVSPSHDRLH